MDAFEIPGIPSKTETGLNWLKPTRYLSQLPSTLTTGFMQMIQKRIFESNIQNKNFVEEIISYTLILLFIELVHLVELIGSIQVSHSSCKLTCG